MSAAAWQEPFDRLRANGSCPPPFALSLSKGQRTWNGGWR